MTEKPPIIFGYYLVAFIDLLGQKEAMAKFKGLPADSSGEEYQEFVTAVKASIGAIHNLQQSYKDFFSAYLNDEAPEPDLPEQMRGLYRKCKNTDIKFQHFSDGLVIYAPLMENKNLRPISSVYAILAASASLILMSLARKQPIRAGVTVGLGAELNENEIYGPVVAEAYKLESEVAQYPRLVVGDELCAYLEHFKYEPVKEPKVLQEYDLELSEVCKGFLARDFDGYPIVSYLGDFFREKVAGHELNKEMIKMARDYITSSLMRFQKEKNSKLAIRYNLLFSYFEHHVEQWLNNA
jgi:hypothetical protein